MTTQGLELSPIIVRQLTKGDYKSVWQDMQTLTTDRTANSVDELWLVEHHPVFTLGQAGKREHLLVANANPIPVIKSDRGGQITYHGPGQLVAYVLLDIKRKALGLKQLIYGLEKIIIDILAHYQIEAHRLEKAPGVYVNGAKIGSIGLRVRKGRTFHGISFNVDMDLQPFSWINPCGYSGLKVTQLRDLSTTASLESVCSLFVRLFLQQFRYQRLHDAP